MIKLVVFNMDNTLFPDASNYYIAKYVAKKRKDFSFRDFLKKEQALREKKKILKLNGNLGKLNDIENKHTETLQFRRGVTNSGLDDIFCSIPFYKYIDKTVAALKNKGIKTSLITTGPLPIAERCQKKFGFDFIDATPWEFINGKFTGKELRNEWNKGKLLSKIQKKLAVNEHETAIIEYSDWNICEHADLVILFNSDKSIVGIEKIMKNKHIIYVKSKNMLDVLQYLV